jgi:hypothetical protein
MAYCTVRVAWRYTPLSHQVSETQSCRCLGRVLDLTKSKTRGRDECKSSRAEVRRECRPHAEVGKRPYA